MIVVDPYKAHSVVIGNTTFKVRGLTDREKLNLIPDVLAADFGTNVKITSETLTQILNICLLGWENPEVAFDPNNMKLNLDRLSMEEINGVFEKAIELSELGEAEVKN